MVYPVKWDLLNPCGPWPLEVDDFNKAASCSHKAGLLPTNFQPFVHLIPSGRTGNISAWSTSWARNAPHFRWTQAVAENTSPGISWYWVDTGYYWINRHGIPFCSHEIVGIWIYVHHVHHVHHVHPTQTWYFNVFHGFRSIPISPLGPCWAFLRPRWCGAAGDGENGLNPAMLDAFQACVASLMREACVRI